MYKKHNGYNCIYCDKKITFNISIEKDHHCFKINSYVSPMSRYNIVYFRDSDDGFLNRYLFILEQTNILIHYLKNIGE